MKKLMFAAAALSVLGVSIATARTISVWGQMFTVEDPQPMMVDVGVLTDKEGHHRMNYIKLKNGHMMAVVPMEEYESMSKMTSNDDMIR